MKRLVYSVEKAPGLIPLRCHTPPFVSMYPAASMAPSNAARAVVDLHFQSLDNCDCLAEPVIPSPAVDTTNRVQRHES
jgi:hypothetical protein